MAARGPVLAETPFDRSERAIWRGSAEAYARTYARLCAHLVPHLLDAAGVPEAGPVHSAHASVHASGSGRPDDGPVAAAARDAVRLLDVGTGSGSVALAALERGARVVLCDAEPGMVALAGRRAEVLLRAAAGGVAVAGGGPARPLAVTAALPRLPFADDAFDAVTAGFVVNHVGRPRAAVAELARVLRPGGRLAVTVWAAPPAPGQTLVGRALAAAHVERPGTLPALDPADDFPRDPDGLAGVLRAAGLGDVSCERVTWTHLATPDEWWDGPASGIATVGQILAAQPARVRASARAAFDDLSAPYLHDGVLHLEHAALLASGAAGVERG